MKTIVYSPNTVQPYAPAGLSHSWWQRTAPSAIFSSHPSLLGSSLSESTVSELCTTFSLPSHHHTSAHVIFTVCARTHITIQKNFWRQHTCSIPAVSNISVQWCKCYACFTTQLVLCFFPFTAHLPHCLPQLCFLWSSPDRLSALHYLSFMSLLKPVAEGHYTKAALWDDWPEQE